MDEREVTQRLAKLERQVNRLAEHIADINDWKDEVQKLLDEHLELINQLRKLAESHQQLIELMSEKILGIAKEKK